MRLRLVEPLLVEVQVQVVQVELMVMVRRLVFWAQGQVWVDLTHRPTLVERLVQVAVACRVRRGSGANLHPRQTCEPRPALEHQG